MADKDYYKTLGLEETASAEDIKKVYRKLALKYHPDKNPGDKTAEERFKKISEAYYALGDEKRRKEYDNLRRMGAYTGDFSSSQGFDFSDFAKNFSHGGARGSRASVFDDIFSDMMRGKDKGGSYSFYSGGAGGGYDDDPGDVEVDTDIKAVLPIPSKLAEKGGEASFKLSSGKNVNLKIPSGTKDGQKMRLKNQGGECPHCRHNGDLILTIKIKK